MSDSDLVPSDRDGDQRTFGPSAANKEALESLVRQGYFNTSIRAFEAAAMLALRKGLDPSTAPPSTGTMWNRGSVNLAILEFLGWYMPTDAPVRLFAQLGNAGTAYISEKVHTGGYDLSAIFELPEIELG
ncbi:hypothetical protein [Demequina activiva]|uniref:Uncharacterized protein n=1 Tax=Demequina activiva TaxID=1582364 RepID=A0A919UIF3_9MICO|nr:hypothetical protein [Demequina activiva]GIG53336.1 hypothetical protein Dac01nite_00880 [Demequina activiva]